MELTLAPAEPGKSGEPGRIARVRRRALPALAVAALIGLPGAVAAGQMMGDDDADRDAAGDEGWGATSFLDESAEDYVQANWERAMDIEPIYTDGVDIEDEDMAPLVGALGVSGIPPVALDAYYNAEDTLAADDPDCGVPWSLLAAIGRVESNHGRFGGAELRADGYGTKPIRGIPLDGRPGVALIRDTDRGRLDDDTTFDRAVGPMQFIPTTWPNVASDGNADGAEDPDNIFDATVGAGVYLCSGDGDLLFDEDARGAAVRRYNNSAEYVRTVLSLAEQYENGGADSLPFEDPGSGSDLDDDALAAAQGELGPELPEPELPAPPAAPPEIPTLPAPPPNPVSVGWPSGMNELPPAQLPPPVPLPTTTTTAPPTTVPPTTVPAPVDPEDPECPDEVEEIEEVEEPTTTTTVPAATSTTSTSTTVPVPADDQPTCEPPAAGAEAEVGDSAGVSTPGSTP